MNDPIDEALRSFAQPTTPEELAERGVRRVRSVAMSQFVAMIELAIDRALTERGLEPDDERRAEIARGARRELQRMLTARDELAGRKERIADLRAELSEAQEEAGELAGDASSERVARLERRIGKLARALEETESSLERALTGIDAGGLRSGARRGDGLDDDDPRKEQKLDLMRGLYDLNRDLDPS